MTYSAPPAARARRTRSPWPRRLAITALVLLLLLVAADRIGVVVAQKAAARTLQNAQDLRQEPTVDIAGFPFLTQLAARDLTKVTVHAGDIPVAAAGKSLTVARLTVVLHDLTASADLHTVRAARGSADATVSYAELSRVLGVQLSYAGRDSSGAGRVKASTSVTVAGQQVSGSVTSSVRIVDGALTFVDTALAGAADLPQPLVQALTAAFGIRLPLTGLPFDLRLREVQATPDGVAVAFTARDLVYRR